MWDYHLDRTVVGEVLLENNWFFPFKVDSTDATDFIFNIFRSFENFDVINDKMGIFVELHPISEESTIFYWSSILQFFFFRIKLSLNFFKYLFTFKTGTDWKKAGYAYFDEKLHKELFETRIYIVAESTTKTMAKSRIQGIFNNFLVFKNYPLNHFKIRFQEHIPSLESYANGRAPVTRYVLSSEEITSFYHFPSNPKTETSLLKVTSRKLALPIGVPTLDYSITSEGEVFAKEHPADMNIVGISDYRSIKVPVGLYDEDRLRHVYVIGKTGVGKSKFLMSLITDDIRSGR